MKTINTNSNTSGILIGVNIFWAVIIFLLCTMPQEDIPNPHLNIPHLDKIVHLGMFFIMALLLKHLLKIKTNLSIKNIFVITLLGTCIYGGIIELLQHYFFNRGGDLLDLTADLFGGIFGYLAYSPIKRLIFHQ
ncbi:MAG: VanZ family protein [Odoribacter sp.]